MYKCTFSKADGVPKCMVRVTSVVPSLPKTQYGCRCLMCNAQKKKKNPIRSTGFMVLYHGVKLDGFHVHLLIFGIEYRPYSFLKLQ